MKATTAIKGFNRTATALKSLRDTKRNKIGWSFECFGCYAYTKYMDRNFRDSYGAAIAALNSHHCPPKAATT